jgi:PAS domain S-box-containing protein
MGARRRTGGNHLKRQLTAEHVAARALLDADTIDEAAPKILEAICQTLGWEHAALWTVDRELDRLRCSLIWNPPGTRFPDFDAISRGATFRRGVGLPGRVWASGKPAWIPDVTRDDNFPRAPIAAREGLHGAFGFPITLRGEVLSVMEFFSREIREPDTDLLSTLASVGDQIGMFIDRRRAQEELDRFFTLSLDLLCVAGFDGYFKRVNPAWQKVLGWTVEELLARPYVELIHPDDREATLDAAKKLTEGHDIVYFENRYFHKDGTVRWLLWASTPFPDQQVVYGAARDITERKAADATMAELVKALEAAKQRAEEATEAKSMFLANVSHEIRTPLTAILGMTSLALGTRLTPKQSDYLSTVKSSAESLLEIINDVLDFSRIEADRIELDCTEFDLRDIVGEAARLLALRAADKGIELACDVASEVPPVVVGDPGRLRQVLVNVLGNAVKFTTEGEVVLRVACQETGDDQVVLSFTVTDTGIGIPAGKLQHIFQAFTQADSSTTRRYGGTGLGLAIAQRLVGLMGGRIWAESTEGRGSAFHFTTRLGRPHPTDHAMAPAGRRALEGLRVLVVDDHATSRRILEETLAGWHMRAVSTGDAATALSLLRDADARGERFDVVVSDCQMPGTDGFSLARQIKRDRRLSTTPIIMLTSIGRTDDQARCQRMGLEAFLAKPVTHSDLLETLAALAGTPTPRPAATRPGMTPLPAGRAARRLRVLVAEDNPVNRKLVTTLLKKRGHRVMAVENGRAAAEAARGRPFDVAVMDLQMPEMSGLEATDTIRRRESGTSRRLPIVGLTAHAMRADRERGLAAGMDAYLTKPIDVDALVATVEGLGTGTWPGTAEGAPDETCARAAATASNAAPRRGRVVFDEQAALAHTGGNRRLLGEVVSLFRSNLGHTMRTIERAITHGDAETLRLAAHGLKGTLSTLGGERAREAAAALERIAHDGKVGRARRVHARLVTRVARLQAALDAAGFTERKRPQARRAGRRRARVTRGQP